VSIASTTETAAPGRRGARRPGRRRWLLAGLVLALVAAGAALWVTRPWASTGSGSTSESGVADNGYPTSLATVTRRSLSETSNVDATLGYAGSYTVLGPAHGTITWLPAIGQVIHNGQLLYRVDGAPVILLYGSTPAYRTLAEGATAADVAGRDVAELNRDLVALGYASRTDLDPSSDEFSWATKAAIERLQEHLDVDRTGRLALGQVVFVPTAARVTSVPASLGGPATGAVLTATSTSRVVTINLDAAQQSEVKVGDKVAITLPDNTTTPGVISSVGTVATTPSSNGSGGSGGSGNSNSSTPTVTVQVTPTHPTATGHLDQAPVEVAITTASVRKALVVPVNALLALSGGGYAVEVADPDGVHHLVDVTLGIFDDADGLVQVTGSGLAAGQHVVVPGT
jgi:hypothetical protein